MKYLAAINIFRNMLNNMQKLSKYTEGKKETIRTHTACERAHAHPQK